MRDRKAILMAVALFAAAGMLRCGGEKSTAPTAVTLAPAPTPTPTPTPSPSPSAQGCRLTPQPECSEHGGGGCCKRESDELGEFVEMAIRDVQAQRPELFDGDLIRETQNLDLFVDLVARRLEQRFGLCAKPGPVDDEVAVKRSNEVSEQFDIIFENKRVNVFGYTTTCRPARF
jgi:hypothetical protein